MNKKIIAWAIYDWANSAFFTTVMAGFFPVFFKMYWALGVKSSLSTERLGWILSISGFALAILSPTMGVIADKKSLKKLLLFVTMFFGVLCTAGLYFVKQGDWSTPALLYGTGLFMCSASCVFYDSLMVSVCRRDQYDFVSSLGFSLGYLGGGLLFLLNVAMFLSPDFFGIPNPVQAIKLSFVLVAVWWFIFTLPLMLFVPEPGLESARSTKYLGWWHEVSVLTISTVNELIATLKEIFKDKNLFYFVVAYWLYIDGVFTVMSMAVDFGMSIGLEAQDLIKALLITQFVGFPAALIFGLFARRFCNRNLILICLVFYFVAILASSKMSSASDFYMLAVIIGISQGGVQALSRSLFAQLTPANKSGEYFGFFNLLGKFASVLGPALMAVSARLTGDNRQAILSLLILITLGGFLLLRVKPPKISTPLN